MVDRALALLQAEKRKQRRKFANDQTKREKLKEQLQPQWNYQGFNAETGKAVIFSGDSTASGTVITNGLINANQPIKINQDGSFIQVEGMPRPPIVENTETEPTGKISADMLLSRSEGSDRVFYVQRKAKLDKLASIPLKIPATPPIVVPDPPQGVPNFPGVHGWKVFYIRHSLHGYFEPGIPATNGFSGTGFSFSNVGSGSSSLWYRLALYQTGVTFEYLNNINNFTIDQANIVSSLNLGSGTFTADQFYESTFFVWRFSVLGHRSGQTAFGCDFEVAALHTKLASQPSTVLGTNSYVVGSRVPGSGVSPVDPYIPGVGLFGARDERDPSAWQKFIYEDRNGDGVPDPIPPPEQRVIPQVDNVFDCYISATEPKTSYVLIRDRVFASDEVMRLQYLKVATKITSLIVPQKKDWRSSRFDTAPSPPLDPNFCKNQYRGGSSSFDPAKDCLSIVSKKLFQLTDTKGRVFTLTDYNLLATKPVMAVIASKSAKSLPGSCTISPNPRERKRYTLPKLKESGLKIRGIAPIFD